MNINELAQKIEIRAVQVYDRSKRKASGEWAESVRSEVDGLTIRLFAAEYTGAFVNGRVANKDQSPEGLRGFVGWAGSTFLKDWVRNKGINISPYAIAWKIARDGIKVPNADNDGQFLNEIIEEIKPDIKEYLDTYRLQIIDEICTTLR